MPPVKPDQTKFPLPPGWQAFTEGNEQRPCRAIQNRAEAADSSINLFMDSTNGGGRIHPWGNSDQPLLHHGVWVCDFTFDTKDSYSITPELTPNPDPQMVWLEVQVESCARWGRARQGLLPVDEDPGNNRHSRTPQQSASCPNWSIYSCWRSE